MDRATPTDPDVRLLQAAADATRLAILHRLAADGQTCARDVRACSRVSQPTVSRWDEPAGSRGTRSRGRRRAP